MAWGAIIGGLASAGAAIFGSERNADAVEAGGDAAAAVQSRALDTSIALSRPNIEVGNSALSVLASLFGLEQPSPVDFSQLGSGGSGTASRPFTPGADLNDTQQQVLGSFIESFGFNPVLSPEQAARVSTSDFASNRHTDDWVAFQAAFGYDPLQSRGNPFLDPTVQQQQETQAPDTAVTLESLVANNPIIQGIRDEGEQAISRGAAARGLNASGGTLQDLVRFNQDLSGRGYQQFVLNPLFELAGFGGRSSDNLSLTTQSNANNLGNIALNTANARGSAFQNQGNVIGNTIGDLFDIFNNRATA